MEGSVGDIERAFHVNLRGYPHPTEPRTFFAPDSAPSLDLGVPVLEVVGLDDYVVPRPLVVAKTHRAQADAAQPNAGSGPLGSYLGND